MKTYTPMRVALVGTVTEVVMGGNKHSGGNRSRSRSRSSFSGRRRR